MMRIYWPMGGWLRGASEWTEVQDQDVVVW